MESLPELPTEIICFHILPRLPAKSLMRFRCVSKSWSSLTRNPLFIDTHRNNLNSNKHTYLLLTTWDSAARQLHFLSVQINQDKGPAHATHLLTLPTPPSENESLHINALTSNGLVCIYSSHNDCSHPSYIFNLCTRESLVLPQSPPIRNRVHVSHHFGFSPISDEYKVLRVQTAGGTGRLTFEVFKLGTSLWRRIEVNPNELPFDLIGFQFIIRGVCVHGAIHWMHVRRSNNVLVVFDIGDERFKKIPLPKDYYNYGIHDVDSNNLGNLVEVGGCVALIGNNEWLFWEQRKMELWILKDYENQVWVKETIIYPFPWWESAYPIPFCTIRTGELLLKSLLSSMLLDVTRLFRRDSTQVWVHLYDMKSKIFRRSEIVLPGWTFPIGAGLEFLASYDDSIISLRYDRDRWSI